MTNEELRELLLQEVQKCFEMNPLIVLGTGFSMPYGIPGMGALATHLITTVDGSSSTEAWVRFQERLSESDLESALQTVPLSAEIERQIVRQTWNFISTSDQETFANVRHNRDHISITRLIRHIFQSSHKRIDIVTTNYDRLAEYAIGAAGYRFHTGYSDGYLQKWDPLSGAIYIKDKNGFAQPVRTAHVWKVHGSLDWFTRNEEPECWPDIKNLPDSAEPLIVTPGIKKYERTYNEPFRSVLQAMDDAIGRAKAVFVVGFGFNDNHLQTRLKRRCHSEKLKIVVVTKNLTQSAKDFLLGGKCTEFLAIEECRDGTRFYTENHVDGVCLPSESLWDLTKLLEAVI
jgi:NAD-dependent SIR2 family protein deacetylase